MLSLRLTRSSRIICFFFSSRRRHTISLCDWSSDVCSSDLLTQTNGMSAVGRCQGEPMPKSSRSKERQPYPLCCGSSQAESRTSAALRDIHKQLVQNQRAFQQTLLVGVA